MSSAPDPAPEPCIGEPGYPGDLGDLDAAATLELAEQVLLRRRAAELEDLQVAAHWAALHSTDPRRSGSGRRVWAEDRLVEVGGEGTPPVQEFCLAELSMARRVGPMAGQALVADVLDLQHRLPKTWARVEGLDAEAWVARKVATLTRALPAATVGIVDAAVAGVIGTEPPSRVIALTQAKVIEADPAAHAAKVEDAKRRRYVALTRPDETGLRHVIARVTAGDAIWVDAMVDRVADLIAADHHDDTGRDELRSIAFGWLARPAELLQLLLAGADRATGGADPHVAESRTTAEPANYTGKDLQRLRPRAVVYVHLHEAAVTGLTGGVARVEGLGPVPLDQLADLLGNAQITIKPVRDLADRVRLSCYEHPTGLKERVRLITDGDRFPFSGGQSRKVDFDHPTPYDADGPPGQTGTHNSGPLGRRHHRWKTHAGYTVRQCGDGRYVWRTRHGRYYLVDHHGTRPLRPADGDLIHDAPPGVDIYLPDVTLQYDGPPTT